MLTDDELFTKILTEWENTDLPEHLYILTAKKRRDRVKRIKAIASSSTKLMEALEAATRHDDQFWIIREIIAADGPRLSLAERSLSESRFNEMRDYLGKLSAASSTAERFLKRGRGQPRNDAASLVLMDIVAIYEWLTGRKASRQVSRINGTDTGPLWKFAAAIWPAVFGDAETGLSSAIKNWDSARKRKLEGTRSPLLANIAMRHPDWGIFES